MKNNGIVGVLAVVVAGIILTAFLWWFFGGFGFWTLPGILLLFVGVAETLSRAYIAVADKKSTTLRMGLVVLFVGLAGYITFAGHVLLGILQMLSIAIAVIGILVFIIGIVRPKT